MEDLIKQAFLHVDVIGPHVQEGHYDLMGPDGEIILPMIWDKTIQPGWQITMRMWPMEKHPLPRARMPASMMPDPRMTAEQQHQFIQQQQQQHMRMRQAQHGGGHHVHGVRAMPMRPPDMNHPGGVPPPPPQANFPYAPQPGERGGHPAGVQTMGAKQEKRRTDGKAAKKTISFFAGNKKAKKKKYVHQVWY